MRMLAVAALALWTSAAAAEEPVRLRLQYDAYLGGIRVLSIASLARFDGAAYDLEVASRTVGIVGWVGDWKGNSLTRGRIEGAALRPTSHHAESVWRGEPRLVDLAYGADRGVAATIEPPPESDDREPVPAALTRGTVDTLTVIMSLVRGFSRGGGCAGSFPAFDGRRRFDVAIAEAGEATLEASSYNIYGGTARRCRVTTRRIAGYWKGRGSDAEEQTGYVWMASPLPGRPAVPVRAEAETGLGTLVLNLRRAE